MSPGLRIAHPLNKNAEPGRATITSTASASGSGNCDCNPQGAQASARGLARILVLVCRASGPSRRHALVYTLRRT